MLNLPKRFSKTALEARVYTKLQWGITSHQSEWPSSRSLQIINAGEVVEKKEPSCTVGENVNWCSHYGEQYGGSLKNWKLSHHMILQSHSWAYIQKIQKILIQKDSCTPMFIAALLTMAKTWKQPKCPSTNEWIKKMWYTHTHTHTLECYSAIKKEWNNAICSNTDGPREQHTKWSQPDRERQILYDITYMWNLKKKIQMNLFTKQKDSQT